MWLPATEALAKLSQRFGDLVWQLTFGEVRALLSQQLVGRPDWMDISSAENNENDPWEEERTWRDPSAHKLRSVVVNWLRVDSARLQIVEVSKPLLFFSIVGLTIFSGPDHE